MTSLAAVVLAHRDARQVRRLVHALEEVPVLLHCDAKTDGGVAAEMARGWDGRVRALPRRSASLGSWSLVEVELAGLREALRWTSATHIAVLSGACYPLLGSTELHARLEAWTGSSYLLNAPVPFRPWDAPRHRDGGRWRFTGRFVLWGDDLVTVRGVPVRRPGRRAVPDGLRLRASSQWKIYARRHVEALLRIVDDHPDVVEFFRRTLVPEESFVASVLSTPHLAGADVLPSTLGHPWFQKWDPRRPGHPGWLGPADFEDLRAARSAAPGIPESLMTPGPMPQAVFARKFSSSEGEALVDRIDADLRS